MFSLVLGGSSRVSRTCFGNYGAILGAIEMSKIYFRPHLSTHEFLDEAPVQFKATAEERI